MWNKYIQWLVRKMFEFAFKCLTERKEQIKQAELPQKEWWVAYKNNPHKIKHGREHNGYMFCPRCAKELNYKCNICGTTLKKF